MAVPAAAVGAIALLVHPLFSFAMYCVVLLFSSATFESWPVSPNQVLAPLFFLSTFLWYLRGRALKLQSPLLPLLMLVALYFTLNAALGLDTERGVTHARYVVIYFILGLSIALNLKTERSIIAFAWILVAVFLLGASAAFYQNAQAGILSNFTGNFGSRFRLKGWAPNSIVFAWQMLFGVPFGLFLYSQSRSKAARTIALAAVGVLTAAAGMTFNRQTYLLIVLVLALSAVLFAFKNRKILLGLIAGLCAVASFTILPILILRLTSVGNLSRDISYLERRDSVLIGMEMIGQYPLFGVGLGSFPAVWKDFLPADYSTFIAQYREPAFLKFPDLGYLGITAETGLVGLFFLLILYGAFAFSAWLRWNAGRKASDPLVQNVSALVFILIIYSAATTAIQDTFLYTWIWMIYGLGLITNARMLPVRAGAPGSLTPLSPDRNTAP